MAYTVRKKWGTSSKDQIGSYSDLNKAKKTADQFPGYFVFNSDGIAVYPLEYMIKVEKSLKIFTSSSGNVQDGSTGSGSFTIVEVDNNRGKLKSSTANDPKWVALKDVPLIYVESRSPGELVCLKAKQIGNYMVSHKYHFGRQGKEGIPKSFRESIEKNWRNSSCTRFASWCLQAAGYMTEGKCIGHDMSNKNYLIDCKIMKVNKKASDLIKSKTLKAGDMMVSGGKAGNYCSIFAGYVNGKKYWYEAGGPFKGVNTTKTPPYTYINIGPLYVSYDYSHMIEYIVRPTGKGNGGIDLARYIM